MGFYIDVTKVEAPSSAKYGDNVSVKVTVKNKYTTLDLWVSVAGGWGEGTIYPEPSMELISASSSKTFTLNFTMPNKSIAFEIYSFAWVGDPPSWYQDDFRTTNISLQTVTPKFTITKPVATPSNVIAGQTVTMKSNITSNVAGTFRVRVLIFEGSIWSGHGDLMHTLPPNGYLELPWSAGQTRTLTFSVKTVRPEGVNERRDVRIEVFDVYGNKLAEPEWDDIYTVDNPAQPSFNITKPVATPNPAGIGEIVQLSSQISSVTAGTFRIRMLIYEGSILYGHGDLMHTLPASGPLEMTFSAGQTKPLNLSVVAERPDGVNERRDVRIEVYDTLGQLWSEPEWDDIYEVETKGFQIASNYPMANPREVGAGSDVTITARLLASSPGTYRVVFISYEGSGLPGHGDFRWETEKTVTFGSTWQDVSVTHATYYPDGDNGSRDIHIDIYDSTGKKVFSNEKDGVYGVHGQDADYDILRPTANPYSADPGMIVTLSTKVTSNFDGTVDIRMLVKEGSWLWGSGDYMHLLGPQRISLNAGIPTSVAFTLTAKRPEGTNERRDVKVQLHDISTGHLLAEPEWDDVYQVNKETEPECSIDTDCPPGFVCKGGVCVYEEPGNGEDPPPDGNGGGIQLGTAGWIGIGLIAAAIVAGETTKPASKSKPRANE